MKKIFAFTAAVLFLSLLALPTLAKSAAIIENQAYSGSYKGQLTSEAAALYDAFASALPNMKDGKSNYTVKLDNKIHKDDFSEILNASVNALRMDHPELYYIDFSSLSFSYTYNATGYLSSLTLTLRDGYTEYYVGNYSSASALETEIAGIETTIAGIISGAKQYSTTYARLKYCHDWLTGNNAYNKYVSQGSSDSAPESAWTIVSAFTSANDAYKGPICEGYAESFKVLCDRLDIPCLIIPGTAVSGGSSGGHVWNAVRIDGVWYNVDVTWDDPTSTSLINQDNSRLDYFLVGQSTVCDGKVFSSTHTSDTTGTMSAAFTLPAISDKAIENTNLIDTTASLSSPDITYGEKFVVTVSVASNSGALSGTLTVYVDGSSVYSAAYTGGSLTVPPDSLTRYSAGNHAVRIVFSGDGDYGSCEASDDVFIATAKLTADVSRLTAVSKDYNGTNDANVSGSLGLSGVLSGDTVNIGAYSLTAKFKGSSPGTDRPVAVTITDISVDNPNYFIEPTLEFTLYADIYAPETTEAVKSTESDKSEQTTKAPSPLTEVVTQIVTDENGETEYVEVTRVVTDEDGETHTVVITQAITDESGEIIYETEDTAPSDSSDAPEDGGVNTAKTVLIICCVCGGAILLLLIVLPIIKTKLKQK